MAGLGSEGAYGMGALRAAIMQKLQMQRAAQQQAFQNDLALRSSDRADQQMSLQDQLHRDQLAETKRQHDEADHDRQFKEDMTINESVPADTFLEPNNPTVGRLQRIGAVRKQEARPSVDVGPLLPGDTGAAKQEGFLKNATAKQIDTQADNARQADTVARQRENDTETQRHHHAMENKPTSGGADHFQLQPEIDPKTGAQTGRFLGYNTKTNSFSPIGGETPQATKAGPGAAQAAQHEQAKKDALGSLDQLDKALDEAKDLVGPMAGRYSNIQQMAGSADPKIQALGTKLLLAKMQVDHAATGTVRAGASPQLLSRWDNLLATKTSHEGLKASVQAMREILGSSGASGSGGTVSMTAPDGRQLNVPAADVARLEQLGAKRAGAK